MSLGQEEIFCRFEFFQDCPQLLDKPYSSQLQRRMFQQIIRQVMLWIIVDNQIKYDTLEACINNIQWITAKCPIQNLHL